ncbi:thiol reductant ABC exporter subunit CydD [Marinobacter nanhaiticus D15-8W]|uniref:Thiol reductant ABC exporter subunit CydD n=1 Tax=Marinobacter nanhaiticus D15-8W TaxID=626887 RepID=N6WZC7_9GAMM|nr:thiol reductant ABC exporter subunit CydD [Marinobacter nanhaiticus D15-8W]
MTEPDVQTDAPRPAESGRGDAASRPDQERERRKRIRTWLKSLSQDAAPQVRLAVIGGVVSAVAMIVQLGLTAWLVERVVMRETSISDLVPIVVGIAIAILFRGAFQVVRDHAAAASSHRIRQRVRQDLISHWRKAGPVGLSGVSPATLASEWLEQVEALHGYFARFLPQMMLAVIVPLLILIVVMPLDWIAAGFLFLSAPLIPLFMALVGMGAEKLNQQHFETLGRLSGHFLDRLRGLTTLQLLGQTRRATEDVGRATDQYRRINMKTLRVAFLSSAVLEFFASVAIAVIAMYIGFGLLGYITFGGADELSLFTGLFILLLAPEFFQPLRLLSQHYHDRASALGAAGGILDRLDTPVSAPVSNTVGSANDVDMGIRLEHITFGFANRPKLLDDLSLSIKHGQVVGIQGPSGCGKSTLLHLIAGFCSADAGEIAVFGEQPGTRPFGWLGQAPFILHGSWADNLRLVAPEASDAQLKAAMEKAGLLRLLEDRAEGLDAPISESGAGLSGGQGRRLALARVFLADYPLVLLDEPTAGLDAESEQQIIDTLKRLADGNRTLVMASHHPALLAMADKVYRLDNGRLHDA